MTGFRQCPRYDHVVTRAHARSQGLEEGSTVWLEPTAGASTIAATQAIPLGLPSTEVAATA